MVIKILHWAGIAACITLIASCFMPWAYFADNSITLETQRYFTGFYSYQNQYGKPGKLLVSMAIIALVCMIAPRVWAKRTNLFICAFTLAYAVKSYILFGSCYNGYCPERLTGLYLMMFSTVIMMMAAVFPNVQLKAKEN